MKNVITFALTFLMIGGLLFSCKKDEVQKPIQAEPVPLQVKLNNKSLVMGDTLEITLSVKDGQVANEKFNASLSLTANGDDISDKVFSDFPAEVSFPKGESQIMVSIPVKESGIATNYNANLSVAVRGYNISGASQAIVISQYRYTVVSIKDNPDNEVKEEEAFRLMAEVNEPVAEDVVITVKAKDGEEDNYKNLPSSLTIPQGETKVVSDSIVLKRDGVNTGDQNLTLLLSTTSSQHPLMETKLIIKKKDIDAPLGEKLEDERWVYNNPGIPFVSSKNESDVIDWYGNDVKEMEKGDDHPKMPDWKFYNALEFHHITSLYSDDNSYGNDVPEGFAAQNTALIQTVFGVDNNKYSTIMSNGYMKMWASKDPTQATGGGSGMKDYGFAAFYSSKFNPNNYTYKPQHTRIFPGMRIEFRARLRGNLNGFNCAIWLQGNTFNELPWPDYGEIDVMENPVGSLTGKDDIYQTFHFKDQSGEKNPTSGPVKIADKSDWNIYWIEFVDPSMVKMGVNGKTTVTLNKSDLDDPSQWPFDKTMNPDGFHLLLTMGAPNEWALGNPIPDGWDAGFADIAYADSKTNDNTPRMEIDWIRYYTNANYSTGSKKSSNIVLY